MYLRERREKKKKEKTRRLIFVISNASLRINRTAIHHETLQLCSNEVSLKLIKDRISSSLYYIYPFILFSMYLHCIFVQLYLRSGDVIVKIIGGDRFILRSYQIVSSFLVHRSNLALIIVRYYRSVTNAIEVSRPSPRSS